MAGHNVGPKNGFWKGGRSVASNGYILVRVGTGHHLADIRGYAYEHRLVAEQKLGRPLRRGEIVHHLNGIKSDNRPANIDVVPSHAHHHFRHRAPSNKCRRPDEDNPLVHCDCGCGACFRKFDCSGRPRRFVSGHNGTKRRADG